MIARAGARVRAAAVLAAALAAAFTLAGFFGAHGQPFELISHFRVQFLVGSGLVLAAAIFATSRIGAGLAALAFAANAWAIFDTNADARGAQGERRGFETVTAIWANLQMNPAALARLATWAQSENPDIIAVTELPGDDLAPLRETFPGYPCITPTPPPLTRLSTVILARDCVETGVSAAAQANQAVYLESADLRIVALHPIPPLSQRLTQDRDAVIAAALALKAPDRSTLMLGDFNSTPYSVALEPVEAAGFVRARCGGPWNSTWRDPNPLLGLSIDHAFLTPGLRLVSCAVGPWIGSDHAPLIVRVQVGG